MYYLYKQGVYGHGVFWIGEDLEVGKGKADEAASNDCDDYHQWQLLKLDSLDLSDIGNVGRDSHNEICYIGKRST